MKIYITTILCILTTCQILIGQSINWVSSQTDSKHIAYANFGYDYGVVTQLGYSHQIGTKKPFWLIADISKPMGAVVFDDLKTRLGLQLQLFSYDDFAFSARLSGNYRQHQSDFVSMKSFGSDFSGILGWYKSKWSLEAELGFDKSIVTHLSHKKALKENYNDIMDGWYLPTGGSWYYGIQVGRTLGKSVQLSLAIGVTNAQREDVNALFPRYLKFGLLKPF